MGTRDFFYDNIAQFFAKSGYSNGELVLAYLHHGGHDFDYMLRKY